MITHYWPAPAKLNLFLSIIGRRQDGYHLLQTLIQFINYGDTLIITPTHNGQIRLFTNLHGINQEQNLIIRAAKLLQRHCWTEHNTNKPGADIWLQKILPIGGGLGGASSNAATVLIVLNMEWNCALNFTALAQLGLTIGTDIPIFIYGNAAFAEGIGDKLTPAEPDEKWYLVVVPPISISTSMIFTHPLLRRNSSPRLFNKLYNIPFYNDCEPIVRKIFPIVEQHLSWLLEYGPARLTGTGACIFAEFDTEVAARYVLSKAPTWIKGFVAQGVNVSPLHRTLLIRGYLS
ncbi:4-(cytidine 5'-diphospho)-2-C-methyl-D-erythritol kinase [Candidatus Curculioniphilus buchneri]|uniref:4-(cytidine 5'-diphospho)-2-C-methyl-D-erythritol kinase n=1 Tax=Candidatus Curculioniphilus buchneri TaxID=690594 RepID=UPI00376EB639